MRIFANKQQRVAQNSPWRTTLFRHQQPKDAEVYWDKWIASTLSNDEKVRLAEQLFAYIWSEQGSRAALNQVMDTKQQLQMAQSRFEKGCLLWSKQLHESALVELQKSLQIQHGLGIWCHNEMEVQLDYALGTVYMGMKHYDTALAQFRQAWRTSGINLGTDHCLTKSAQHMIETVLLRQRCGKMDIHHQLSILRQAIIHEKEGDYLHGIGELEAALEEYKLSVLEYRQHQDHPQPDAILEQAALRCKMATILEDQENREAAGTEWATALSMYQALLGNHHPATMETMTQLTANHACSPR